MSGAGKTSNSSQEKSSGTDVPFSFREPKLLTNAHVLKCLEQINDEDVFFISLSNLLIISNHLFLTVPSLGKLYKKKEKKLS